MKAHLAARLLPTLLATGCVCDRPGAATALLRPPEFHLTVPREEQPGTFHAQVHRWLDLIRGSRGAIFVRNGMDYGGDQVALSLQRRWELKYDRIHSAEDFLQQVATRSETSGQVYQVLLPDGRLLPLADWLRSARHS